MTDKSNDHTKLGKEATLDEKLSCRDEMFSKAELIGFSEQEIALLKSMYEHCDHGEDDK